MPVARSRVGWFVLAVALGLVAVPATGFGEVRAGSTTDSSGDQVDPQRDITAVSANYDTAGSIAVTTTFREAPTAASDAAIAITVGTPSTTGCGLPAGILVAFTDPASTVAVAGTDESGTATLDALKSVTGQTLTVSITNAAFAAKGYACVTVSIQERSPGTSTFDATDAPIALSAPPPLAPPPGGTPVGPSPAPQLTNAQKLARALRACRTKQPVAARRTCERRARTRFAPPLTNAQKLTRAIATCRTIRSGAARRTCITRARARFGPKAPAQLARRVYYYPGVDVAYICGGVCWEGYAFVDANWVYRGLRAKDGLFPTCTTKTAAGDDDGCLPYTFNPATNTGTIDGTPFTLKNNRTDLNVSGADWEYGNGSLITPGTRLALELKGIDVFGNPFVGFQTVSQRWLATSSDGRFILSSLILGSTAPGSWISVNISTIPPDRRGTYEFLADGLLRLTYDDGRVVIENVFVLDTETTSDPAVAGLFLGGTQFFKE